MDSDLAAFLAGRAPLVVETATWGTLDLQIRYYVSHDAPPDHLITSCRAIVLGPDHVLVIQDPTGDQHIVPGGRRRPGEALEHTLHREVLEETCWTVADLSLLAAVHFHITSGKPDEYQYPYPDFVQVVFMARPLELDRSRRIQDEWVLRCEMVPIDLLDDRPIAEAQRLLLGHALRRRQ